MGWRVNNQADSRWPIIPKVLEMEDGQKQFKINNDQWSNVSIGRILYMKLMTFYNLFLLWLTYSIFIFVE